MNMVSITVYTYVPGSGQIIERRACCVDCDPIYRVRPLYVTKATGHWPEQWHNKHKTKPKHYSAYSDKFLST